MSKRSTWIDLKKQRPLSDEGRAAYADEARISAFRELVYRLRTEAGLTQAELAPRPPNTSPFSPTPERQVAMCLSCGAPGEPCCPLNRCSPNAVASAGCSTNRSSR